MEQGTADALSRLIDAGYAIHIESEDLYAYRGARVTTISVEISNEHVTVLGKGRTLELAVSAAFTRGMSVQLHGVGNKEAVQP